MKERHKHAEDDEELKMVPTLRKRAIKRMTFISTDASVFPRCIEKSKLEEINSNGKKTSVFLDNRQTIKT